MELIFTLMRIAVHLTAIGRRDRELSKLMPNGVHRALRSHDRGTEDDTLFPPVTSDTYMGQRWEIISSAYLGGSTARKMVEEGETFWR